MTDCVLITGVHGFCARHLVKRLTAEGVDNIYGTDIHPAPPEKLDLKGYSRLDIRIKSHVHEIVHAVTPDIVFHLAGLTQGVASEVYHVNFLGSVYLLEAVRRFVPGARVLLVGSAAEYGHVPEGEMPVYETRLCSPYSPYGISKYAMTIAAMSYGRDHEVKVIVARPFNIVGAGMPASLVVGAVLERIKHILETGGPNLEVPVGNLDTYRDFIAIDDVMDAYMSIIQSQCWGEIYNICSGKPRSIRSVIETLITFSEKAIRLKVVPELIRSSDVLTSYGSFEKAQSTFGFHPKKDLDIALKDAWEHAMGVRK